jgi:hypothetical protein
MRQEITPYVASPIYDCDRGFTDEVYKEDHGGIVAQSPRFDVMRTGKFIFNFEFIYCLPDQQMATKWL